MSCRARLVRTYTGFKRMTFLNIKPKNLARAIYPLVALILITLFLVTYSDFRTIEQRAKEQSQSNIDLTLDYLEEHFIAIKNNLYLLGQVYQSDKNVDNLLINAEKLIGNELKYLEIGVLDENANYFGTGGAYFPHSNGVINRPWFREINAENHIDISPIYKSGSTGRWTVAVVYLLPYKAKVQARLLLEIDIQSLYLNIGSLKTLNSGYVYVVEKATGRIVMHPNNARLGSISKSITPERLALIASGKDINNIIDYRYQDKVKFSLYKLSEDLDWLVLSGVTQSELKVETLRFGGISLSLLTLMLLIMLTVYIFYKIHNMGRYLTEVSQMEQMEIALDVMARELMNFNQCHLFIYNAYNQEFEDLQNNISIPEFNLRNEITHSGAVIKTIKKHEDDPIARTISAGKNCVRIPLMNKNQLLGIIYLTHTRVLYPYFIAVLRNYAQSALINVLLTQKLRSEDPMTSLMNKSFFRQQLAHRVEKKVTNNYVAMIDIDNFKFINDTYGHLFGDTVIIKIADILQRHFNKHAVVARYGGEEYVALFPVSSDEIAQQRLDDFRQEVEDTLFSFETRSCSVTVSVGFSPVSISVDHTILSADLALYRAKSANKNKVFQAVA